MRVGSHFPEFKGLELSPPGDGDGDRVGVGEAVSAADTARSEWHRNAGDRMAGNGLPTT